VNITRGVDCGRLFQFDGRARKIFEMKIGASQISARGKCVWLRSKVLL
jgi:hypothetical protein